ncbi:MAG: anaerobic ribonucleoside-triphosphate reductase activating protein [Bacilli bacterium]|nr:anaerobic ribonucleoside-triphosphate reductase activating protein [Bacilli bacterium]
MEIRLAAPLQSDSVVDGFGVRTVIWTQGCSHNCPFCQNPSTHSFDGGALFDIEDIKSELDNLVGQDGITLSGGDPLFQIDAVTELSKYAKEIGLNIWCYTGFTYEKILEMGKNNPKYLEFLTYLDVLVDGKFENDKKDLNLLFRGSSNQRLIDMKKTLKYKKVILIPESDGIIEKFKSKEKMYI